MDKEVFVAWFRDLSNDDVGIAGGKGASLAEMYNTKLPVPPGFVVTAQAYKYFVNTTGIQDRILSMLKGLDVEDTAKLQEVSRQIQELILRTPIPYQIKDEIVDSYDSLNVSKDLRNISIDALSIIKTGRDLPFVAVRSSATAEDLPSISKDEHILVKINDNVYFRRMEEIYSLVGDGIGYNIFIPAISENRLQWVKVESLYRHAIKSDEKLYKITTKSGREIVVSPNHTLIILDEKTLELKNLSSAKLLNGSEFLPAINKLPFLNINCDKINVLDYIPKNDVVLEDGFLKIKNNSTNWKIQSGLPLNLEVNTDFAYFLGVYCAEGSVYGNNEIIITNSDDKIMSRVIKYVDSIGLYNHQKINKNSLRIYNKTLLKFLVSVAGEPDETVFGKGKLCKNKKVPEFVFGWNKDLIGSFLRGAFDGDGCVSNQEISYCSTSRLLISGMIKLLEFLGIEWNLYKRPQALVLLVKPYSFVDFNSLIGFESLRKKNRLTELLNSRINNSYDPRFNETLVVSSELSDFLREKFEENLEKKEVTVYECPTCNLLLEQTSSNSGKKRYYCHTNCKKVFYKKDLVGKTVSKIVNYNALGQFTEDSVPWNKGKLSQKYSLNHFKKLLSKNNVSFDLLNETIKWDKISSIEPCEVSGDVYDFSVPGVQNFAAGIGGIITHNSASFAGQQATYVNVKGNEKVVEAVQKCWASLYTARAIYYRTKNDFDHSKVYIAVVVQKMVDSEKAGVMFTANPVNSNQNEIIIDAAFGLGDAVVAGEVTADNYVIDKNNFNIVSKKIGRQEWMYAKEDRGQTFKKTLSEFKGNQQKLTDEEIEILSRYAVQIETHYKKPMDIEWAIESHKIYIVQARPITTLAKMEGEHDSIETSEKPILEGLGASPGVAVGHVKIVNDMDDLNKIKDGDILVAKMTNPDYVVAMKKAKAIVTDEGAITSHAAIVSRELQIPCVVGTSYATSKLKDGDLVTVDGSDGDVYLGEVKSVAKREEEEKKEEEKFIHKYENIKTKTKIYMNLGEPEKIDEYKHLPFEGIGLMRVEFIITSTIGKHPLYMVKSGLGPEFIKKLASGVEQVASAIAPRPLIVRFSDFKSNEYKNLEGGSGFEPHEENPMIGWRGVSRYISVDYEKAFRLECQAIRKVRETCSNVYVMLPFVRNTWEVEKCLLIMKEEGLVRSADFKVYLMAEVPSIALIPEEFATLDIDGASIGSNDLTQLCLGVDRDSGKLANMGYFDERNNAVKKAIVNIIDGFHKCGKTVSICGQAPSTYPEVAEFLVSKGIDTISVNPDVVEKTHAIVAKFEKD